MTYRYDPRTGLFEEVEDFPQINSFTFEGSPIKYKDETVIFNWNVQDAQRIFINGIEVPKSSSSFSYPLSSVGLKDFVLRAENGGNKVTKTIQIKIVNTPIFNIVQSTDKLRKGKRENCLIKWDIKNISSVRLISETNENIPFASERNFSPESSTDYRFEAVGLDNRRVFSYVIRINVWEESKVRFEVDKNMTLPHVPIKLFWEVENASCVELAGFDEVDFKGEKIIDCDRNTVFILKVTDAFGTTEYKQTISMYPLPLIRSILIPTPEIERNIRVETNFDIKHIQIGINVNMAKIPIFKEIKSKILVSCQGFHKLSTPIGDLKQKINSCYQSFKNLHGLPSIHSDYRTFMPGNKWWKALRSCFNYNGK